MDERKKLAEIYRAVVKATATPGAQMAIAVPTCRAAVAIFCRAVYVRHVNAGGAHTMTAIAGAMHRTRQNGQQLLGTLQSRAGDICRASDGFVPGLDGKTWQQAAAIVQASLPAPYTKPAGGSGAIVSLDPSSTCTGYAVWVDGKPYELGRIKPSNSTKGIDSTKLAGRAQVACGASVVRYMGLMADLAELLYEYRPEHVVIEVSTGRAGTGSKLKAGPSLITYGQAVGCALAMAYQSCSSVVPVTERAWTRGLGKKDARMRFVYNLYPALYQFEKDKGGDIADAVLLYRWAASTYSLPLA